MPWLISKRPNPSSPLQPQKNAIETAIGGAHKTDAPYVVSIVDDGGHLIYLERADGVAGLMPQASILKAQSSAGYGVSTKAIEDQITQGHSGFLNLPRSLPMEGGVPVFISGHLVGAVGVAGGVSAEDGKLAARIASQLGQ